MAREHRVPLADAAITLLRRVVPSQVDPDAIVFPGVMPGRPLSDMALTMLLRKMGYTDVVPHGFRSTFRDWAAEVAHADREVAEAALAHAVESKVEAAYRRGDLFERRRVLMDQWATFAVARLAVETPTIAL